MINYKTLKINKLKIKKMRTVSEKQHKEVEKALNRKFDYVSPEVYAIVKSKQEIEYNDKNNVKIELVYIQEK